MGDSTMNDNFKGLVGKGQSQALPSACGRAMGTLMGMLDEPLDDVELDEFAAHAAQCSHCAQVVSDMHDVQTEAIEEKGEQETSETMML